MSPNGYQFCVSDNGQGKVGLEFRINDTITGEQKNLENFDGRAKKNLDPYDAVILTPTARVVREMKITPPLTFDKKMALDSLSYFGSVKIFLKFTRPFWAEKNKIKPIYYNSSVHTNGASAVSDDLMRLVS